MVVVCSRTFLALGSNATHKRNKMLVCVCDLNLPDIPIYRLHVYTQSLSPRPFLTRAAYPLCQTAPPVHTNTTMSTFHSAALC